MYFVARSIFGWSWDSKSMADVQNILLIRVARRQNHRFLCALDQIASPGTDEERGESRQQLAGLGCGLDASRM